MLDARVGLGLAVDPCGLMRLSAMEPDSWQARLQRSKSKRILALCGRQTGKSTVCAAVALHTALFTPKGLVLLVSPSQRQSGEVFRKIVDLYRPVADLAGTVNESALRIELGNGSRVISLPGTETTTRGFSAAALIVIDEAARVEDGLYFSIRPSLAVSDGRMICVSTGSLRNGWFYDAWMDTSDEWERFEVTSAECPRISAEFLARERAQFGDLRFRAEYGAAFVDSEGAFFDPAAIRRAFRDDVPPLFPADPESSEPDRRASLSEQWAKADANPRKAAGTGELDVFGHVKGHYEDDCCCASCRAEEAAARSPWRWF